ncbi:hypothetical protein OIDMADRAFT_51763 [Oidiodendron maius Zn]|uniref:Uncharacterized protein n=1 Tax=Oidiodendron maius (strain Zn) TaxID=913774 RepID=A0A0C3HNB7_OIDMZ|nr:hypothetical protein OIDMADRAFT_51763 [Oidiodendron maius Zn]
MNRIQNPRIVGPVTQPRRKSLAQSRWNSTQPPAPGPHPVSPHIGFYKTFARPVAKVLLMATLTYQLAYWAWVRLEKDEIKAKRRAEIHGLEEQLKELTKGKGGNDATP